MSARKVSSKSGRLSISRFRPPPATLICLSRGFSAAQVLRESIHIDAATEPVQVVLAGIETHICVQQTALDLVIQRLFALGVSITASASDERMLSKRLAAALHGIDQIIDTIQETRQTVGP